MRVRSCVYSSILLKLVTFTLRLPYSQRRPVNARCVGISGLRGVVENHHDEWYVGGTG
jgi:hypothetical protein